MFQVPVSFPWTEFSRMQEVFFPQIQILFTRDIFPAGSQPHNFSGSNTGVRSMYVVFMIRPEGVQESLAEERVSQARCVDPTRPACSACWP
jgi:hypothetical protein